jgi:hypothetical protein
MSTSASEQPLSTPSLVAFWIGRVVGGGSVFLGLVALWAVNEVGPDQVVLQVSVGLLGLVGGFLFLLGLERPAHRLSRIARLFGWVLMAAFAMFPGMVWFLWGPLVLAALPAVFLMKRRAG